MEKNIVLAQIGKNSKHLSVKYKKFYQNDPKDPSAYELPQQDLNGNIEYTESSYSFQVILNELEKKESKKANFLILVGTQESSWANLYDDFFSKQYGKALNSPETSMKKDGEEENSLEVSMQKDNEERDTLEASVQKDGSGAGNILADLIQRDGEGGIVNIYEAKGLLEQFLTECLNGTIVKILIQHNGITPSESENNFNLLLDMLSETLNFKENGECATSQKANLHLDISNGFRSLPVYVFLAANYIAQIQSKEESIRIFMYYGMFEKKLALENGRFVSSYKGEFVPYVDMSDAADIIQWTDAIAEFYNSGSVIQILKILNSNSKWADIRINGGKDTITSALRKFNYAINTNNLKLLDQTTHMLVQMRWNLDDSFPQYAKMLLEYISDDFHERFNSRSRNSPKYGILSIKIAEWYLDQQRIGDAVIALQEGMITYVMEKFPLDCEILIKKKIEAPNDIAYGTLPKEKALFDFKYREIIQKYVFDVRDLDGKEWMEEYKYICDHLRDPGIRMQYNIIDKSSIETNMEDAVKNIRKLIQYMSKGSLDAKIGKWIKELLNMQDHDIFISYRRTFKTKNDGVAIARSIAKFLKKQTFTDKKGNTRNFDVFWDMDGLLGTAGEFPPAIRHALMNSRYVVLITGKHAFKREYSENDYYYMEIQIATDPKYKKEIFVVPTNKLKKPRKLKNFPKDLKREIQKIVSKYQLVGGGKVWDYSKRKELCQSLLASIRKNMEEKEKK